MPIIKTSDMKSVGRKMKPSKVETSSTMNYPNIYLDDKQSADIKKLDFGDEITIHAHAKVTSMNESANDGGRTRSMTLEIRKMALKSGYNPATSVAQRRATAIAEHHPEKLYKRNRGLLEMSKTQLHKFATTKEKGRQALVKSRRKKK